MYAPRPQTLGVEIHVLNIELLLTNPTVETHTARVFSSECRQGDLEEQFNWKQQPDLSHLNHLRGNHVAVFVGQFSHAKPDHEIGG